MTQFPLRQTCPAQMEQTEWAAEERSDRKRWKAVRSLLARARIQASKKALEQEPWKLDGGPRSPRQKRYDASQNQPTGTQKCD